MKRDGGSAFWPRVHGLLLLAAALGLGWAPDSAEGRELWPNNFLHFFSEDMRPVEVMLRYPSIPDWDKGGITFAVPRAWIAFVTRYDPLKLDRLPDRIETSSVKLALADPNGAPLSAASRAYARERRVGWSEALKALRPETYYVSLTKVDADKPEEVRQGWRGPRALVERDGVLYDTSRNGHVLRASGGALVDVNCTGSPNWQTYCDYWFRLNPDLLIKITFLDFRFQGGEAYALARIRRVLGVMCQQSKPLCSQGSLSSDPNAGRQP